MRLDLEYPIVLKEEEEDEGLWHIHPFSFDNTCRRRELLSALGRSGTTHNTNRKRQAL